MFIGQYEHSLEEKGRLLVPKNFRPLLAQSAVITKGLDGCLFLYPKQKWEALLQKLASLPITQKDARAFSRLLTYGASEVYLDRIGRILIPQFLRSFAHITNQTILAGNLDKVDIWDKKLFDTYQSNIESKSEEIAEKLNNLGI